VTIAALADLLRQELNPAVQPVFNGVVRAGDPCNWRADVSRLEALGFTPKVSLEQGARGVATWASAELANL
jgi:UDP-glucose 4-epimerase